MDLTKSFLTLLLAISPLSFATDIALIASGFVSGEVYTALSPSQKNMYTAGVIDGILVAPLYGAPEHKLQLINQCITGMTGKQMSAVFDKYLKDHPEIWHKDMHIIAVRALDDLCINAAQD